MTIALQQLNAAHYPVGDLEVDERGDGSVEVTAVLVSTAVVVAEIEAVVAMLAGNAEVAHVAWERGTLE